MPVAYFKRNLQYTESNLRADETLSVAMLHLIHYAALTDVGIRRSHNQDACACQPAADDAHYKTHGHVFVVADGMGGHAVGEKASAKAIRDIPLTYQKHVASEGPLSAIRRAVSEANAAIFQIGMNNPEFKGLGTTGTALFLRREGAWLGHVGDSRAYRIRGNKAQQLTFDHSWVWEIARRQGVDPDELGDFKKNVIIRSLGPEAEVEVDVEGPHPLEPGDAFLMCSDGLTNHVKPDELGAVVSALPPADACEFLVALANVRGGSDNITCLIAQVPWEDGAVSQLIAKESGFKKFVYWWGKRVSWPLTGIALGAVFVVLSILMQSEKVPGATFTFILAALLTIAGIVGLAIQMRKKVDTGSGLDEDGEERPLQIYKEHPFLIDEAMCNRISEEERHALKAVETANLKYDREAYAELVREVNRYTKAGNWLEAFRARCRSLLAIAEPLNNSLRKDEAFKPNWTTPQRLGGNG